MLQLVNRLKVMPLDHHAENNQNHREQRGMLYILGMEGMFSCDLKFKPDLPGKENKTKSLDHFELWNHTRTSNPELTLKVIFTYLNVYTHNDNVNYKKRRHQFERTSSKSLKQREHCIFLNGDTTCITWVQAHIKLSTGTLAEIPMQLYIVRDHKCILLGSQITCHLLDCLCFLLLKCITINLFLPCNVHVSY